MDEGREVRVDPRVTELHYIAPLTNVSSILQRGLLSHSRASRVAHQSVADPDVQVRRANVTIPNGLTLHSYVNLYFNARNPMMYKRRDDANQICVLRVSTTVIQLPGVVLTDMNASKDMNRFLAPSQWQEIAFDDVFADYWTHTDEHQTRLHKGRMCAEVLVPHRVDPTYLQGAHVASPQIAVQLTGIAPTLQVSVTPRLFFR